jgi:hypothetical protein
MTFSVADASAQLEHTAPNHSSVVDSLPTLQLSSKRYLEKRFGRVGLIHCGLL